MASESFGTMRLYVVYRNPSDYPGQYVARGWTIGPRGEIRADSEPRWVDTDLGRVRQMIEESMGGNGVRLEPSVGDDPCIYEVWI